MMNAGTATTQDRQISDLTRLNRKQRRELGKKTKTKIGGRNLPFVKKNHGTPDNYYRIRAEELEADKKLYETTNKV